MGALIDTDRYIHELYSFVGDFEPTTIRAPSSRAVIDVYRDPSTASPEQTLRRDRRPTQTRRIEFREVAAHPAKRRIHERTDHAQWRIATNTSLKVNIGKQRTGPPSKPRMNPPKLLRDQ